MSAWLTEKPVVIEFVPPPMRLGAEGLEKRFRQLEKKLAGFPFTAVNVPQIREEESRGGDRKTPFEPRYSPRSVAREITQRFGIPAIVNHVVNSQNREAFVEWLMETHGDYGIGHLVLVGPSSSREPAIGPSVAEANSIAQDTIPDVRIGNICIPGRTSKGIEEPERMQAKAETGIDFFTSQIMYHATPLIALLDGLAARCPGASTLPLLVSLCPLRTAETVRFLHWLGVELDEPTAQKITADPDLVLERSIEHLSGVWSRVRAHVLANGLTTPLGLNIAPVGPVPASATLTLARALENDPTNGS